MVTPPVLHDVVIGSIVSRKAFASVETPIRPGAPASISLVNGRAAMNHHGLSIVRCALRTCMATGVLRVTGGLASLLLPMIPVSALM